MPVPQGAPSIPYRSRHHVALWEEVASQAVGELAGIDLVVLLLGCSNRAQHQRVSHLDLGGVRKQMIVDPAAEDRRFHRHHPGLRQRLHPAVQLASGRSDLAFLLHSATHVLSGLHPPAVTVALCLLRLLAFLGRAFLRPCVPSGEGLVWARAVVRDSFSLFRSSRQTLRRWKKESPESCVLVFSLSESASPLSVFRTSHSSFRRAKRMCISSSLSTSSCSMSRPYEATMSTSALVVHAKVNRPEMPMMGLMFRQCRSTSRLPMPSVV